MADKKKGPDLSIPDFPEKGDPSYESEARSIIRGLEDKLLDLKRERKDTRRDYKTSLKDTKLQKRRTLGDLGRDLERGLLDLRYQKADVRQDSIRGGEDFASRLASLTRDYSRLGANQNQAINAGGGRGALSGQARAAQARRAENLAFDRQPLDTSLSRLEEDTTTSLERLGTQTGFLRSDVRRAQKQTRQDFRHDKRLMHRDFRRDRRDMSTERQRALREGNITVADLLSQAAWANKRNN